MASPGTGTEDRGRLDRARPSFAVGLRGVTLALLVLYGSLLPLHLLLLTGAVRTVMVALVVASLALLLAVLLRQRQHPGGPRTLMAVTAVPAVNSLTHLAVTGELHQTTTTMLVLLGFGAVLPTRRAALPLVAVVLGAWVAVVLAVPVDSPELLGHYLVQLAMATVAAVALLELRVRRDGELAERLGDLEQARASLTAAEAWSRSLVADSPVGIGLADEHGHLVSANEALCRLWGRPAAEVVGRSSLHLTHPDDRAEHARASERLGAAQDGVAQVEKRYVRPDGEVRWAWLSLTRVAGPGGEPWTLAHVQDVTARHAAERALADSEANLAAVARVVRAIRAGADARTALTEAACAVGGAMAAHLIEPLDEHRLVVSTSTGTDMLGVEIDLRVTSATAHVWRTGEPLFIPDPLHHPLCDPRLVRQSGAGTLMWEPVVMGGRVVAVLAVAWREVRPRAVDRKTRLVALLADEAAVAIEHDSLLARYALLAATDELTSLPNRRAWEGRLVELAAAAARSGTTLVVAVADVDHFKAYNDHHGHPAGDALLRELAARWRTALRQVDVLARWGGEEFTLALPDCADPGLVLDRLRAVMPTGTTVSVGWTTWQPGEDPPAAVARADRLLFAAKRTGRDRVVGDADSAVELLGR